MKSASRSEAIRAGTAPTRSGPGIAAPVALAYAANWACVTSVRITQYGRAIVTWKKGWERVSHGKAGREARFGSQPMPKVPGGMREYTAPSVAFLRKTRPPAVAGSTSRVRQMR